jgi:hypothetical protein
MMGMFTPYLYDHKFDIDDIIVALCGDHHPGLWQLDSRHGTLTAVSLDAAQPDGSDNNHIHHLTPLPLTFLHEMGSHPKRKNLSADDTTRLDSFLASCPTMHTCITFFEEGPAGGWLRERIKEEALEWLDQRGMIPPSMRHAWKTETTSTQPSQLSLNNIKVRIE